MMNMFHVAVDEVAVDGVDIDLLIEC